jgi:transposase
MNIIVYYDPKSMTILDFLPTNVEEEVKDSIRQLWNQDIPRKILVLLSQESEITAPIIKQRIGHSMSTLHENINKLEQAGLIHTEMIYKGNKQKIIKADVLCVSKNAPLTARITRFLNQGLWVDTSRSKKIVQFLKKNPNDWFSTEDISAKTGIQVDEVETLLKNWDSQITRSFSDFLKQTPFEKKVIYRFRK